MTVFDIFVDLQTNQRITTEWEKHKGRKMGQRCKEGKKVHINLYSLFWEETPVYSFESQCGIYLI